jgi:hypothetical protein
VTGAAEPASAPIPERDAPDGSSVALEGMRKLVCGAHGQFVAGVNRVTGSRLPAVNVFVKGLGGPSDVPV